MRPWAFYTLSLIAVTFTVNVPAAKFDTVSPKLAKEKGCLSCHEGSDVGARVSRSGDVTAQSGDLQGTSGPIEVASDNVVQIIIDSRVP